MNLNLLPAEDLRTNGISSLSDNARQGAFSLASIMRLTTGTSTDVGKYRDAS